MKYRFLLLLVLGVIGYSSFSQNPVFTLKINSTSNLAKEFNEKEIKVEIITKKFDEKSFGISLKTANNKQKSEKYYYSLYLFDEKITNKYPAQSIKSPRMLYNWTKNTDIDGFAFSGEESAITFSGSFILFDKNILDRVSWDKKGYYAIENETDENLDRYSVKTENLFLNSKIVLSYVFLVKENKSGKIVGLTEPVKHQIPLNIIKELLPSTTQIAQHPENREPEKKEPVIDIDQKPDGNLVREFQKKANDLIAPFKSMGSYHNSWNDYELYKKYAEGNYNRQISDLINNINASLREAFYNEQRIALVNSLDKYLDKENTVRENIDKLRPKNVNKCDEYKKSYHLILQSLNEITAEISEFENIVIFKIRRFEKELAECQEQTCYIELKSDFERQSYQNYLNSYSSRINTQSGKYNSFKNKPDYKSCDLSASTISMKINDTEAKFNKVKQTILNFKVKIEGSMANQEVFKLAVSKFETEIIKIIQQFNSSKQLYQKMDDEFFSYGSLKNSHIAELEKSSSQLGQMSGQLETISADALRFYEGNDNLSQFPEALFWKQTGVDFTTSDIDRLKSNIDQLIFEGKTTGGGNLITKIIIALVLLLLIVGGYSYFKGLTKRKTVAAKQSKTGNKATPNDKPQITHKTEVGGMEIIDDDNVNVVGKGLDKVRKLSGIEYFEVDVQAFIKDTTVRKVFFSRNFVKKAYWYFEDKMNQTENIDDLYEFGGYIIGKWDHSPYDDQQYDLSLEHFIEPGNDAKFTKFNIDFGYDISFRMEEMLIDLANNDGDEQVFVGWLHSHPGHNVFLSNYDIDVQEKFRNQYHPNRHIALVLEPTTKKWDMGLFSFNSLGKMNNKDEVSQFLSFDEIYNWAKGEPKSKISEKYFSVNVPESSSSGIRTISFDKSTILDIKKFIERELSSAASSQKSFYFSGVKSDAGNLKSNYFIVDMIEDGHIKTNDQEKYIGVFTALTDGNSIEQLQKTLQGKAMMPGINFLLVFKPLTETFLLVPITQDKNMMLDKKEQWIEFSVKDIVPFLRK
jgi:hypothetical protein